MAYAVDVASSANRHLRAAACLEQCEAGVAGYLYGLAAEMAIKAMMLEAGIRPVDSGNDPFYAHFPVLRSMLRDLPQTRQMQTMMRFVNDNSFMNNWSIDMRYSHGRDIAPQWITSWAGQARQAVASIGT